MISALPQGALSRVLTVLALVALLMPATGARPVSAQSQADLDELEGQIEEQEEQVQAIDGQIEISIAQLNEIIGEQRELQAQLDALNDELAGAQTELDNRERILAATTAELEATAARLDRTRDELVDQQQTLEDRVRQSYISARPDSAFPLIAVGDAASFTQATTYLQAIQSRDRAGFEQVAVLETRIAADEAELERLRGRQDDDRAAAQVERDRVAGLVAQQEALVAEVQQRAADKQTVLAGLEADRDTAEALIAEFEAESAEIERELAAAAAAEEERRRQAAAAAAAAASSNGSGFTNSGGSSAPDVVSGGGSAGVSTGGRFILPVGGRISSEFGYRVHPISGSTRLHAGMDIAAGTGTPIGAAGSGTVIFTGWRGGYGNTVIVDHGGGITTLYAHQSRIGASVGQSVSTGQVIGYVGSTGYSTGPHLHWEVRVGGSPTNPRGYI
ncbi:murein hydrolase activator EnvC family protein [Euzebya tangerina]|uniref:murein hydrolase activator EnvC family protein n=1 Tax=Euzebya tangerina TaxID=591198 RepID=UPI00196B5C5E|nr:M23 family metallopeptidase [Euzebya tangerina]